MTLVYLDTSAFVKTIVAELGSAELKQWLVSRPQRVSCALLRTEAIRAVRAHGQEAVSEARSGLRDVRLVRVDDRVLDAAADIPGEIRSLDAIHVAAALMLGPDLEALVTYDRRMNEVASTLGLPVVAPGL